MFHKCFCHLTFKTVWYMTNKEMKILKKKKEMEIQRCQVVRVLYIFKSSKLAEGCTANKEKPQIKLL